MVETPEDHANMEAFVAWMGETDLVRIEFVSAGRLPGLLAVTWQKAWAASREWARQQSDEYQRGYADGYEAGEENGQEAGAEAALEEDEGVREARVAALTATIERLTVEWQAALERARVMRDDEIDRLTDLAERARSLVLLLDSGCDDAALKDDILRYLAQALGPLPGDALAAAAEGATVERATEGELPAHLRDDAPSWQCDTCGRRTWDSNEGAQCGMPQPNGTVCGGRIVR